MDDPNGLVYRWSCPLCEMDGMQLQEGPDPQRMVANTIQAHIRSVEDEIHGPKHHCPDEFSDARLAEHVSPCSVDRVG